MGVGAVDYNADSEDEKNWTKNMEKKAMSKFQEVQLTSRTEAGSKAFWEEFLAGKAFAR